MNNIFILYSLTIVVITMNICLLTDFISIIRPLEESKDLDRAPKALKLKFAEPQ